MNAYVWTVGEHLRITAGNTPSGPVIAGTDGKRHVGPALLEPFLCEKILELAGEVERLKAELEGQRLSGLGHYARGALAEREAVVKYLLADASAGRDIWVEEYVSSLARSIGAGEHHPTTSPSTTSSADSDSSGG